MSTPARASVADLFSADLRGPSIAIFTTVALSAFEGLAVAAALPRMAAELGGVSLLPWVVTAYLLPSGVATVAAGALVDRVGVAKVFRVGLLLFVLGGATAGLAPSMGTVVAARLVQGVGSGALNATGLAAVGLVYPKGLVARAFAANATVWGVMSVAGPALAAGLLAVASWRWIFLVNIPLGAAALAAGWRAFPRTAVDGADTSIKLDPLVLSLLTLITFGSLYAVDALDPTSVVALVVTVAAALVLLRRERGRPGALIAPRHVVDAPLGPLAWGVALLLVGGIGLSTFLPLYLTAGRGASATAAAWSVVFFTLGWTTGANVSSRLMDRRSPMAVTRAGAMLTPVALAVVAAAVATSAPVWVALVPVTLAGSGIGAATNSALTTLRQVAADVEIGRAVAAHQFVRNFGFALGNAMVGAVVLFVVAATSGEVELVQEVLAGQAAGEVVAGTEQVAAGIRRGFAAAVAIGAALAATAWLPLRRVEAPHQPSEDPAPSG